MTVATIDCCAPIARGLSAADSAGLAVMLKAVADPVRLRLLSLIGSHTGGECCVDDLTGVFDLTAPTISHHLKVSRTAGLIDGDRRGTRIHYRLLPDPLTNLGMLFTPSTGATGPAPGTGLVSA
ncbi:metalloregulator ArsR/SmtB family transcription factor [Nonomuraea terrae]|uniref:metalloregulator ArsR/SmtB family transcription factor n=1 Tax=Nonomuraea terrae TaxID=2530383 RepID=UPI0037A4AC6E